jgi:hypothetical protein
MPIRINPKMTTPNAKASGEPDIPANKIIKNGTIIVTIGMICDSNDFFACCFTSRSSEIK